MFQQDFMTLRQWQYIYLPLRLQGTTVELMSLQKLFTSLSLFLLLFIIKGEIGQALLVIPH